MAHLGGSPVELLQSLWSLKGGKLLKLRETLTHSFRRAVSKSKLIRLLLLVFLEKIPIEVLGTDGVKSK